MDSYRGNLVQLEPADLALHDDKDGGGLPIADDDEIGREPLPASVGQQERRMQVRAYNYWAGLLGDRALPHISDVSPASPPDFADHAVMLDFSQGTANPAITMLGEKLAEECGAEPSVRRLSDVPGRSLLSRITDHYRQILASEAPIGFEAEFVNQRGTTLLYRGILLPFAGSGDTIQHVMGVINWKELADPIVTAELRQELDRAVGAALIAPASAVLGAWADGPVAAEPGRLDADPPVMADHAGWGLDGWLGAARESAEEALDLEERSRAALYAAIGRAWDFALAAEADPPAFREMLGAAGLAVPPRAPMAPIARLVFGAACDKTRLAEFTAALDHARRQGVECGGLAGFLAGTPGGLKRVVGEERQLRRAKRRRQDVT